MRLRWLLPFAWLTGSIAHADDPPPDLDDLSVSESSSLLHDPGEPLLTLDVVPRPNAIGLGVTEDTHRAAIKLGPRATLYTTGTGWQGYLDAVPIDGNEDPEARGWSTGIGFAYDFGWLQLDASITENTMSSRFGGSGRYRDVQLTLSKSKKLTSWLTGFIALSIGNRTWEGEPPPGEPRSSSHFMLSVGAKWK